MYEATQGSGKECYFNDFLERSILSYCDILLVTLDWRVMKMNLECEGTKDLKFLQMKKKCIKKN